jgi:glycine/D-amino acid oxidase-like deaminating enzyme
VSSAIVLGAGIQGVCAALALARRGLAVTLVDEAPDCMLRTSYVNEGKVHLGHVYANDPTFETPRLMLRAALSFAPLLERLVGRPVSWPALASAPFVYCVARDSQLTVEELFAHYARLDGEFQRLREQGPARYLHTTPARLWEGTDIPAAVDPAAFSAAVATPERAIDPRRLRGVLAEALHRSSRIDPRFGHRVEGVARAGSAFVVDGRTVEGLPWTRTADLVVNCLWSGRLAIDARMGLRPRRPWVYRLKYRVLADLPAGPAGDLPSLTIVLGKYGDLVTRDHDRSVYLSWYPVCLRGWSSELAVPDAWRGPTDGQVDPAVAAEVGRHTLRAFGAIVPGLRGAVVTDVRAGVIVCWGATDIDDPSSELHRRRDIGVHDHDGYFSIDTGKLTCAPLFATELADRVAGIGPSR